MKIDSNELRKEMNKLFCEMGLINKKSILIIIEELEKKEKLKEFEKNT